MNVKEQWFKEFIELKPDATQQEIFYAGVERFSNELEKIFGPDLPMMSSAVRRIVKTMHERQT